MRFHFVITFSETDLQLDSTALQGYTSLDRGKWGFGKKVGEFYSSNFTTRNFCKESD